MAGLSSPGVGSGLDINGLVSKLMDVERIPLTKLDKKEADYQAKLTAYGTLKGALSTLQTAMSGLSSPSQYNSSKATAADATVLTASTLSIAKTGSYSIEVESLAQAYKISTAPVDDPTASLGTGTLRIDFGTYSYDGADPPNITGFAANSDTTTKFITIDSTQNSLNGIRDAINAANAGVTASIINVGSAYRLVVSSNEGGAENAVRIKVSDDSDGNDSNASGLSTLAYDPVGAGGTGAQMSENQQATDAVLKIDGVTVTKSSNTISDAIQGVTLNLLKTNDGSPTTLTVSRDTTGVKAAVQSFVKSYNDLIGVIKNLDSYDAETKKAGVLLGDSAIRSVQSQLRNVLGRQVTGNGGVSSLSDIGVSFQRDGTLSISTTKLDGVLADSTKNVGSLFATMGVPSDSLTTYAGSTSATQTGEYGLEVTEVASHGVMEGSVAPVADITSNNNGLRLSIDGKVINVSLSIANGYTASSLASEIQQKINTELSGTGKSVSVTNSGGKLRIASSSWGTSSKVELLGGSGYFPIFGDPDMRGRIVGSQAASTTITTGINDTLSLTVDGTAVSIRLTAGTYGTPGDLASALETSINNALGSSGVSVTEASGVLTIASTSTGTSSFVSLNGGTGISTLLGNPDAIAATGRNVAGYLGGIAATGSGQTLTGTGEASGLALLVAGGLPGARGTVSFSSGIAAQLNSTIAEFLDESGTITGRTEGINTSIKDVGSQRTMLNRRLAEVEKRYRAQFNALDSLVASMQQTSAYLTQQLTSLSKSME